MLAAVVWLTPALLCAESAVRGVVDGKPVTEDDLKPFLSGNSAAFEQAMKSPEELLRFYGYVRRLAAMAEKAGVDKQAPLKEQLEHARAWILAQAQLTALQQSIDVSPQDQQEAYARQRERFTEVRVQVIEVDANRRDEASKLAQGARSGASFADLQKQFTATQYSDWTVNEASGQPASVKAALLKVETGSVVGPLEAEGRISICKVTGKRIRELGEVQSVLYSEIQQQRLQEMIRKIRNSVQVEVKAGISTQ